MVRADPASYAARLGEYEVDVAVVDVDARSFRRVVEAVRDRVMLGGLLIGVKAFSVPELDALVRGMGRGWRVTLLPTVQGLLVAVRVE